MNSLSKTQITEIRKMIENEGRCLAALPVSALKKNYDINPRKHQNPAEYNQRKLSMKDDGQKFPISVRILDDDTLEVVSGNTRTDIAGELQWKTLDAIVRILSDDEARREAEIENIERADMTPIEEADVAHRRMDEHANNKAAVAKSLGWSTTKLDSRLLLTHATTEVRKSLAESAIEIGHAEVLSTLAPESQAPFLEKILEEDLSVTVVRQRVAAKERRIIEACFDTEECSGCVHNTDQTLDLFSTTSESGRCRKPICFTSKTKDHLLNLQKKQIEEVGRAEFASAIPADKRIPLVAVGDTGVGEDQLTSCHTCEHSGCVISDKVGEEGHIKSPICFNKLCHDEKREEFKAAIAEQTAQKDTKTDIGSAAKKSKDSSTNKKTASSKNKATAAATPKIIQKMAMKLFADTVVDSLSKKKHPSLNTAILLSVMLEKYHTQLPKNVMELVGNFENYNGNSMLKLHQRILEMNGLVVEEIIESCVALYLLDDVSSERHNAAKHNQITIGTMAYLGCDPTNNWKISTEYFDALTKKGIKAVLVDAKFDEFYTAKDGNPSFAKLMASGKPDLIKTIMKDSSFFDGYLPLGLRPEEYRTTK